MLWVPDVQHSTRTTACSLHTAHEGSAAQHPCALPMAAWVTVSRVVHVRMVHVGLIPSSCGYDTVSFIFLSLFSFFFFFFGLFVFTDTCLDMCLRTVYEASSLSIICMNLLPLFPSLPSSPLSSPLPSPLLFPFLSSPISSMFLC